MSMSKTMFDEASGTPPAFAGTEGKTGISNALNNSRLQQATLQVEVFTQNYRDFCRRRAVVMANYWKIFYKAPMTLRITGKEQSLEVNRVEYNHEAMEVEVFNDLSSMNFDVAMEYSSLQMQLSAQKSQAELAKMQADMQIAQLQAQQMQMQMQGGMPGGAPPQGMPPQEMPPGPQIPQ
jgi:hypothetical protein